MFHLVHGGHFFLSNFAVLLIVLAALILLSKVGLFKMIGGVFHLFMVLIVLCLAILALKFLVFSVALGSIGGFLLALFILALIFG